MEAYYRPPASRRAKIVNFIWRNIPRAILLCMVALILVCFNLINKEKKFIEAEKAEAVSQERPIVNAVALVLSPVSIKDRINLPGSIEPWTRLELKARVGGMVDALEVNEGDEVKKGDLLIRIDTDDYRIALDRAKAAYELARANYERDKAVYAKGIIPTTQMDIKETNLQTAKADLENAELLYSRCMIKAPMAGVVKRLDAKVGLLLSVGDPVAEILKIDQVKAVVGIPESDISAVRRLDTVDLTVQALDNRIIKGKKHFLSPAPETAARLFRLELALDNPDRSILPGMFVRADVVKRIEQNAVAIPFYSVVTRNDEQFVFVEEEGVAVKRPVKLGIMEKWMVQVTQGLSPGERILVEGHRDVENNQPVNVVKTITNPGDYSL